MVGEFVAAVVLLGAAFHLCLIAGQKDLFRIVAVAFVLRILFVALYQAVPNLPGGGGDEIGFDTRAIYFSSNGFTYLLQSFTTGRHLYTWLVAISYYIFGPYQIIPIAVNVWLGTVLVVQTFRISMALWGNRRSARCAAWIVALFPSCVIYSAILFRDIPVIVLLMAGVGALICRPQAPFLLQVAKASAFFVVAVLMHSGMIGCLAFIAWWIFRANTERKLTRMMLVSRGLAMALFAIIIAYVALTGRGLEKFTSPDAENLASVVAERQTGADTDKRTEYLVGMRPSNVLDIVWQMPIRLVFFLCTPFPWSIRIAFDVVGFGLLCVLWCLIWLIFIHWRKVWNNKRARYLCYLIVLLAAIFGMGTSSYGTAIRHRTKLIPLLAVIVPIYHWKRKVIVKTLPQNRAGGR